MSSQLTKILIVAIFAIGMMSNSAAQQQSPRYEIIIDKDGFSSFGDKDYTFLTIFLNNDTNETLYYQGSDCSNLLFKLYRNPYFHLAIDICKDAKHSQIAIPPHRSQKMEVYLIMDKTPDRSVSLIISMDLYKWGDSNSRVDKKYLFVNKLSDSITLHYNAQHQNYSSYSDFEMLYKKEERILPNKDIYLLNEQDRKQYILKVDENQISRSRDTVMRIFGKKPKRAKSITVPVIVQNNSDEELKFYSMTCSWEDFFGTDDKGITIPGWGCDSNMPNIITVGPHKEFRRDVNITYAPTFKTGKKYRISMSLVKPNNMENQFGFFPGDYIRYNKIWTNEITIKD
ncbi:MAG TPA: hypothetical protein VL442_02020 [Mucilaginibacter sp.]|jgi:hypothetical protein|nr:hypothetical protein [Mucilaginibacter sp.]